MARYGTSYLPNEDEDERDRELEGGGYVPPAPPPPAPKLPAAMPATTFASDPSFASAAADPLQSLAKREDPTDYGAGLPAPPMMKGRTTADDAGMALALLADLALNKGSNAGLLIGGMAQGSSKDVPYENYKRQMDHSKALADLAYTRRRGFKDAESDNLAAERLRLAQERFAAGQEKDAQTRARAEALRNLDSDETRAEQDMAIGMGMDAKEARKYTGEQLRTWRTQIGRDTALEQSDELIRGRMQYGDTLARGREERGETRKIAGEEREEGRTLAHRATDFGEKYAKNLELELDIAALTQDIEASPGGAAPQGFFEKFRNQFTARGIDPERIETWQAKQMVLELWARNQTGAAISQTEDGRFATQTGLDMAASPEQVEAAYKVMQRLVARRLRGAAAPNRGAVREIFDGYGLDADRWLGAEPQRAAPGRPKPGAAEPGNSSDLGVTYD